MIVEVSETTMTLINKYQNTNQNSPYLFPILSGSKTGEELYTEYQQALRTMNYNLDRLAKKCGVSAKVSSYTLRHTWATLAKYCNFSEQLICEALGHSSVKVTEIYLKGFKNEVIKKRMTQSCHTFQKTVGKGYKKNIRKITAITSLIYN